ncbi:MAG: SMC-Scp complex subunit ScpB [Methanomicrobia archaeon]|nr:SMC-Scp complex subunit ScpB [Methanomicrobia archaeon]
MKEKVEAVLFVFGEPLSIRKIASILNMRRSEVEEALNVLSNEYSEKDTAIEIINTVEDEYVMQLKPQYSELIKYVPSKTPKSLLKTLALIALKQPVTQINVVKIRGNHAYLHIKKLEEQRLINKKPKERTYVLTTTKKFAEYYGLKTDSVEEIKKFIKEKIDEED